MLSNEQKATLRQRCLVWNKNRYVETVRNSEPPRGQRPWHVRYCCNASTREASASLPSKGEGMDNCKRENTLKDDEESDLP